MSENIHLTSVNLFVKDMAASLEFYRRLGLDIPAESVWPSEGAGHHTSVPFSGDMTLELDSWAMTKGYDPAWQTPSGPSRNVIIFRVPTREAVDALYARMTATGGKSHLAPFDAFWGARYAVIEDPDGNQVGIMSPQDPARQSAPPGL